MIPTTWLPVEIDISRSTEFTGDDVDRFSDLCSLGGAFEFLTVIVPALSTAGEVSIYIQRDAAVATIPVILHAMDDDATGSFAHSTSSITNTTAIIFRIGGAEFFRVHVAQNQSADRIFYVRGFNRG